VTVAESVPSALQASIVVAYSWTSRGGNGYWECKIHRNMSSCNFSDISDELNLGSRTIVSSLHSISVSHHLESNVRIRHTRSFHARRLSEYSLLSQLLHFPQVTTERGILHSHSSKDSFRKVLGAVSLEQKAHVNDQGLGVAQT
jgi:hypothetical protein